MILSRQHDRIPPPGSGRARRGRAPPQMQGTGCGSIIPTGRGLSALRAGTEAGPSSFSPGAADLHGRGSAEGHSGTQRTNAGKSFRRAIQKALQRLAALSAGHSSRQLAARQMMPTGLNNHSGSRRAGLLRCPDKAAGHQGLLPERGADRHYKGAGRHPAQKPHDRLAEARLGPRQNAHDDQAPAEKAPLPARGYGRCRADCHDPVRAVDGPP